MSKRNPLLTKAVVEKRLSKIAKETDIDVDLLAHDLNSGRSLNDVSANAFKVAELAKEQGLPARTVFAQYVVQTGVADLAKNIEILHKRVQAFQVVIPSRQFQYTLQDLVSIVDHLGDFLHHGPKEPDSDVPLSASMVAEEIPAEEAEEMKENAEAFEAEAELIAQPPVDNVVKIH